MSLALEGRSIRLASGWLSWYVVNQENGISVVDKATGQRVSYLAIDGVNDIQIDGNILVAKSYMSGSYGLQENTSNRYLGIKWNINKPAVEGSIELDSGYLYQSYWSEGVDIYKLNDSNSIPNYIGNWKHWCMTS